MRKGKLHMSTTRASLKWLAVTMMIASGAGCIGAASTSDPESADEESPDAPSALSSASVPAEIIKDTAAFGFDLYHRLATDQTQNVFISPVSISSALAMTYAGARGQTREQMTRALHVTLPDADVHPAFQSLLGLLESRDIAPERAPIGETSLRLDLVNTVWLQENLPILPSFRQTIAKYYEGGFAPLDFARAPEAARQTINSFVERKTEQKIKNLLPPGSIQSSTQLVLTNTAYFYGSWMFPFDPQSTKPHVFHAPGRDVRVPMMHGTRYLDYVEGRGFQMIQLPYIGDKLAMIVVLPAQSSFAQIRDALTPDWIDAQMRGSTTVDVRLSMPKLKFTYEAALERRLQDMGMVDAFSPRADFSGIVREGALNIDEVYHKTFLAVDEYGTEAAAATAIPMTRSGTGPRPEPRIFTMDRPFIVLIRDASGAVVFLGQVVNPK